MWPQATETHNANTTITITCSIRSFAASISSSFRIFLSISVGGTVQPVPLHRLNFKSRLLKTCTFLIAPCALALNETIVNTTVWTRFQRNERIMFRKTLFCFVFWLMRNTQTSCRIVVIRFQFDIVRCVSFALAEFKSVFVSRAIFDADFFFRFVSLPLVYLTAQ